MSWQSLKVEKVAEGKNVRHWRVAGVTVRESALYSRVYACLTCRSTECDHVLAVREFDGATTTGALESEGQR